MLGEHMEKVYGNNAFAFIVDEGGACCHLAFLTSANASVIAGFGEQFGTVFASLGIAEKGYVDVRVDIASPGGHSSIPPPHTVRYLVLL